MKLGEAPLIHGFFPFFFHLAITALRAISDLRFAESFLARALPPFDAPSFPNATAIGFFFLPALAMDEVSIMVKKCESIFVRINRDA
jgi:hypothetical protein